MSKERLRNGMNRSCAPDSSVMRPMPWRWCIADRVVPKAATSAVVVAIAVVRRREQASARRGRARREEDRVEACPHRVEVPREGGAVGAVRPVIDEVELGPSDGRSSVDDPLAQARGVAHEPVGAEDAHGISIRKHERELGV